MQTRARIGASGNGAWIGSALIIAAALAACNGTETNQAPPPTQAAPPPEGPPAARGEVDADMERLDRIAVAYEERLLAEPPDLPRTRKLLEEASAVLERMAGSPPFPEGPDRARFIELCLEGAREIGARARAPAADAEMDLLLLHSYLKPIHDLVE